MTTPKAIKTIEVPMSEWSKFYTTRFRCNNCRHENDRAIPKGVKQKGLKIECDNCGCTVVQP